MFSLLQYQFGRTVGKFLVEYAQLVLGDSPQIVHSATDEASFSLPRCLVRSTASTRRPTDGLSRNHHAWRSQQDAPTTNRRSRSRHANIGAWVSYTRGCHVAEGAVEYRLVRGQLVVGARVTVRQAVSAGTIGLRLQTIVGDCIRSMTSFRLI